MRKFNWPFLLILIAGVAAVCCTLAMAWRYAAAPFLAALNAGNPWAGWVAAVVLIAAVILLRERR